MSRSPYAIRKGFEYQDLVCCHILLRLIENTSLDVEFEIESDNVEHIDDLVLYLDNTSANGNQVKFHVTQEYAESFDTLTSKKTNKSSSILQKLHRGWTSLLESGHSNASVTFISSNPAERGRYKLGPAIQTATGRFHDKFFDHNDYESARKKFLAQLDLPLEELRRFLAHVEWKFGFESIDSLRRELAWSLKRIHLPNDEDAVSRFLEVIGEIANCHLGRIKLSELIHKLWTTSKFRDACERQFAQLDFGISQHRRANSVAIAAVSLDALPAFVGGRYACLDEPFPFPDYRLSVSANDYEGHMHLSRRTWKHEYLEWVSSRVTAILLSLEARHIDILTFPRFSLPLSVACKVAEWCRIHECHLAIGGHSWPDSEKEIELYATGLNIALPSLEKTPNGGSGLIVDAFVRYDRAGRASVSALESPYAKSETVIVAPEAIPIKTSDGWVSIVLLPSKHVVREFSSGGHARPELVIVAGGIHGADTIEEFTHSQSFTGVPLVVTSGDAHCRPSVMISDPHNPPLSHDDGWEGVRHFTVRYERSISGWTASYNDDASLPLVYHSQVATPTVSTYEHLRGLRASRNDAVLLIQRSQADKVIICKNESPAEFYFRRSKEADHSIRSCLLNASPGQLGAFSKTLEIVLELTEKFRADALVSKEYAPPPQVLLPARSLRFFNRATEKTDVGRFLSSSPTKRILLIYGASGIGKRELITEVQRVQGNRDKWIRFRCPPGARLLETVCQLLVRLGITGTAPKSADHATFAQLASTASESGTPVLILEDAHFLPIAQDHEDHSSLLDLLGYWCSDEHKGPKLILLSDWRGHLQFSGSHRMQTMSIDGLQNEYIIELLQEHLSTSPCMYEQPTVDELLTLASKLHGHPFLARLAAVVLQDCTASEVIGKLYSRTETRNFVLGRLLSGMPVSDKEKRLLQYASLHRTPVYSDAFNEYGGPASPGLVDELVDRFLMLSENGRFLLHPILRDYFGSSIETADDRRRLHGDGFNYYEKLQKRKTLTVEERTEFVYHAVSAGKALDMSDMQMFAGSMRSALTSAVRNRDWIGVEAAARHLLSVWPYEAYGQVGLAIALDATGREHEANQYIESLENVSHDTLWLALEFVKSLMRRRDYDSAARNLAVIRRQFSNEPRVVLTEAQLLQRQGMTDEAIEACENIISRPGVREQDALQASLILRDANRLDLVIKHLQTRYESADIRNDGLLRLYSLASVTTLHDPNEGLQVLSEIWQAAPQDGFAVADYATALIEAGRAKDAHEVLERGREAVPKSSGGYRLVLEADALLFERQEKYLEACERYRELSTRFSNHLHLYRHFARCLLSAAGTYRSTANMAMEDAFVSEARQVLERLLQMAPLDKWAVEMMHRADSRIY